MKGLNALIATVSTHASAPVIAATRLRKGSTNSVRGAAKLLADALATARGAGANGRLVARADSAFYSYDTGAGEVVRLPVPRRQSRADAHRRSPTQWTATTSFPAIDCPRRCPGTKASGTLARRPELDKALLSANRVGDQPVVTKLDRLGRSLEHLIDLSNQLQIKQVDLVVLDQGIDTSTAIGRMFFQIVGAIAEFEHALLSERTIDGLSAARARGRTGGQKPKLGPRQVKLAREMYEEVDDAGKRRYTVNQIASEFGVTHPTIYRHLAKNS